MNDRLPDNLALLYEAFSPELIDSILPGDRFEVEGVEFVCKYSPESTADRFCIVKTLDLVERYRELCQRFEGGAIFELGIAEGGSTALMALLARPRKLIAVDLEPQPLGALDEFVRSRGLTESVRPFYGVDQSDRARLNEIIDAELAGSPLDLVIDDCSHQLALTRASFEALFPSLRPGGLYVIEDWNADHLFRDAFVAALRDTSSPDHEAIVKTFREGLARSMQEGEAQRVTPLSRIAVELLLARAREDSAVEEVTVDEHWIIVRRGSGELDPRTFQLNDLYTDHFGQLDPELAG